MDGLAAGDAAVIAASAPTAELLRDAVDGDPDVHILDRGDVYRARTPAAITTFRQLADLRVAEGARRVRVVGEVDFGPTERDWLEWQRYEAVINDGARRVAAVGAVRVRHPAPARAPPGLRAAHALADRDRARADGQPAVHRPGRLPPCPPAAGRAAGVDAAAAARDAHRRVRRPAPRPRRGAGRRRRARGPHPGLPAGRRRDDLQRAAPRRPAGRRAAVGRRRPHRLHDLRPGHRLGRPLRRVRAGPRRGPLPRRHGAVAGPPALRPRGHLGRRRRALVRLTMRTG